MHDSGQEQRRYLLRIAYDGTAYHGWQVQHGKRTVAGTLQDTFKKVFGVPVSLQGASRTDAGVHALDQVALCTLSLNIQPEVLHYAWNNKLPGSIVIRSLEQVPLTRNPHQGVESKTYWYHLFTERPLPFVERYGWFYRYPVDLEKLQTCLAVFVGTHDFRSFCTGDEMGDDTVRLIESAGLEWSSSFSCPRIAIKGPRFLRYMVRRVVGACVEVASHKDLTIEHLKAVLAARNPEHTLPNAPAQGLMLASIVYKKECEDVSSNRS